MISQKNQILLISFLIVFLDYVSLGLVYPLFPTLLFSQDIPLIAETASTGERGFYLGILLTSSPLVVFLMAPLVGGYSDYLGRKKVLLICTYVGVISYFISFLAIVYANLWLLIFSRALSGISIASGSVVAAVLMDIAKPEERTKFFGWYDMFLGLGMAMGPFIGGALSGISKDPITKYSFPFALATFIMLLTALALPWMLKETVSPKTVKNLPKVKETLTSIFKAFSHPNLSRIFIVLGIFSFGWCFYWGFIPVTWMEIFNFSSVDIGNIYGFAFGVYALSCGVIIRPLTRYFKASKLFLTGLVSFTFTFILMGTTRASWSIWVLVALQQILLSFLFPTSSTLLAEQAHENEQGELQGLRQSIISLAFAIAPIFSGALLGLSIFAPIYVGAYSMILGAIIFYPKVKREILKTT